MIGAVILAIPCWLMSITWLANGRVESFSRDGKIDITFNSNPIAFCIFTGVPLLIAILCTYFVIISIVGAAREERLP